MRELIYNYLKDIKLKYLKFKFMFAKKYTIGYILSILPKNQVVRKTGKSKTRKGKYIVFDGIKVFSYSRKYYFFKKEYEKNRKIICPICNLQANYFKVTPTGSFDQKLNAHYTFNLYGVNNKNQQIMFDIDHIVPISKGGKNEKNNLRILCHDCNNKKADK